MNENNVVKPNSNEETEIDLLALANVVWENWIMVALCTVVVGAIALFYTLIFVTPIYQSSAMLYVNNSALNVGSTKIDLSDLNASKSLADTYSVILKSRTTLEMVIQKANLNMSYQELDKMVSADTVNDTEVFRVTVTSSDPSEAARIANTIVAVLPERINTIMEGSAVKIVDTAVVPDGYVSPSFRRNTAIGMILGALLSIGFLTIRFLMDTLIHTEDYLLENYPDIPLLAVVPTVGTEGSGDYYSYGYGHSSSHSSESGDRG